jgi:hypothetical protein
VPIIDFRDTFGQLLVVAKQKSIILESSYRLHSIEAEILKGERKGANTASG